jgi:hypothetical protein
VNLGWDVDEHGEPFITYATQWREGDLVEGPRPDGHEPDINLHGLPLPHGLALRHGLARPDAPPGYFDTD